MRRWTFQILLCGSHHPVCPTFGIGSEKWIVSGLCVKFWWSCLKFFSGLLDHFIDSFDREHLMVFKKHQFVTTVFNLHFCPGKPHTRVPSQISPLRRSQSTLETQSVYHPAHHHWGHKFQCCIQNMLQFDPQSGCASWSDLSCTKRPKKCKIISVNINISNITFPVKLAPLGIPTAMSISSSPVNSPVATE